MTQNATQDTADAERLTDRDGRPIIVVGGYDDGGPDDPAGLYYRYADETKVHFASASSFAVRFGKAKDWEERAAIEEQARLVFK